MLPGLTELLMAAQLTLGAQATPPTTIPQPATRIACAEKALEPLATKLVNCKYADFCCKPASGCTCNGGCSGK